MWRRNHLATSIRSCSELRTALAVFCADDAEIPLIIKTVVDTTCSIRRRCRLLGDQLGATRCSTRPWQPGRYANAQHVSSRSPPHTVCSAPRHQREPGSAGATRRYSGGGNVVPRQPLNNHFLIPTGHGCVPPAAEIRNVSGAERIVDLPRRRPGCIRGNWVVILISLQAGGRALIRWLWEAR